MKTNPTRALAIAAGLVIIALTGAAFWLSYAHLAEVALGHGLGEAPRRAWAWPATLDLFIVAGELLMLRAALAHRVDPWAIGLTVIGSGGSIALNVAGVGSHAQPLDYVVAAVPPTAALLAFGALMRQIHQALAGHVEPIKLDVIQLESSTDFERVPDAVPDVPVAYPEIETAVPAVPEAVPPGVRLLPIVARPEAPRTRAEVHAEYVPEETPQPALDSYRARSGSSPSAGSTAVDPPQETDGNPAQADPLGQLGMDWAAEQFKDELLAGKMPGIHRIKAVCKVGQDRAKEIQDGFREAQVAWRLAGSGVSS